MSAQTWTIGSLLETAAGYLREKGSSSPRLDAELLLADVLATDRVHLYTEHDRPLTSSEVDRYRTLVGRRARREPVAYILGRAYFRRLELEVTPAVLIPRPETEELVDVALEVLRRRPIWGAEGAATAVAPDGAAPPEGRPQPSEPGRPLVADVGCGSGAIALSIAQETGLQVLAVDVSAEALEVARRNRDSSGLEHLVGLRQADLLEGVPEGSLHLIVSNPPYVTTGEIEGLEPDVRCYEPLGALEAGEDGLDVYRRLLPAASRALRPGGAVVLEVGHTQAAAVSALAAEAGFGGIEVHKDLSGKDRIVEAGLPGVDLLDIDHLDEADVETLAAALRAGGIIGLPTDTVYGLAAAWDSREGVRRLFATKGREEARPVAVIFGSVAAVQEALPDLDDASVEVMAALLPGPYTFVVSTSATRPRLVGTPDSLGVRVPDLPPLLKILDTTGLAVAATSANLSGEPAPATAADVAPAVRAYCSAMLVAAGSDEGPSGTASTVVDLRPLASGDRPVVLREGAVGAVEVMARIDSLQRASRPELI